MSRLCERPGCSAPAAVAYGMDSDRLLVWLEVAPDGVTALRAGVLCRRHADAMIVPRGWTLDDRRESTPRLFRVADAAVHTGNHPSRGRRTRAATSSDDSIVAPLQLAFEAPLGDDVAVENTSPVPEPPSTREPDGLTVGEIRPLGEVDPDETRALPWRPIFEAADDLDGLLKANTPLLSRAFRVRDASPPGST